MIKLITLEAVGITKSFPGVLALDNVDVAFKRGTVHGIVGENGAGKSTLVKVLTGVYTPDRGTILIDGEEAVGHSPLFRKLAYVPQELDLFDHMSVAENLFMPFSRSGFSNVIVRRTKLNKLAVPWLEKFQIQARPTDLVKDISVSNQQLLQIARAAVNKYFDVLILDEPTTSLTERDTERLFSVIQQIKEEDKAIIFISHKLDELFNICDELTVLRNGRKVAQAPTADVDRQWIIKNMTAREIVEEEVFRPRTQSQDVILEVNSLSGLGFSDIDFELRKGEILGFAGLVGSGRTEIMQTLFGYLPMGGGSIRLNEKIIRPGNTHRSIRNGLYYLPEERKQQGILPLLSVKHNISISFLNRLIVGPVINRKKENEVTKGVVSEYEVKTPSLQQQIRFLSGGNQQKVIIGRAMRCSPEVLIFDEPTKGIDVGAKVEIYRIMRDLVEKTGIGIILISSDLNELVRCSNRIITIYAGGKTGEFSSDTDVAEIMDAMFGETIKSNGGCAV